MKRLRARNGRMARPVLEIQTREAEVLPQRGQAVQDPLTDLEISTEVRTRAAIEVGSIEPQVEIHRLIPRVVPEAMKIEVITETEETLHLTLEIHRYLQEGRKALETGPILGPVLDQEAVKALGIAKDRKAGIRAVIEVVAVEVSEGMEIISEVMAIEVVLENFRM
jgi:hypothetical protein